MSLNPHRYIVTGTDTGLGKTVFAAALARHLCAHYWKPVQAGLDEEGDAATVARLGGLTPDRILPEAYRLNTPCSPHAAAAIDGVEIMADRLTLPDVAGPLVVEGAGGVLVPLALSPPLLFADVFARWGLPAIVVARTSLGTISHSLMSIEALRARGVAVHGMVFVGDENMGSEAAICAIGGVRHLGRLPVLSTLEPHALAAAFAANMRMEWL